MASSHSEGWGDTDPQEEEEEQVVGSEPVEVLTSCTLLNSPPTPPPTSVYPIPHSLDLSHPLFFPSPFLHASPPLP